jgi:AraC family transcriptional regulator
MPDLDVETFFAGAQTASFECPSARVQQFRFEAGVVLPRHDHPEPVLVLQLRGGYCGSVGRHSYELGAGAAARLPATTRQSVSVGPMVSEALLVWINDWQPSEQSAQPAFRRPDRLRTVARQLAHELRQPDAASALILEGLLFRLRNAFDDDTPTGRDLRPRWLDDAIDILRCADLDRSPSLSDVALDVGVHPSHLARCLKQRLGMSAGAYIRQRRVAHAATLLAETDHSISWVALECGFYDQSHFCNVFRGAFSMTPTAFRAASPRTENIALAPPRGRPENI